MTEQREYEELFHQVLPFVDAASAAVARSLGLRGDDAEEFTLEVKERLWEGDYAVLRKWRRESKLTTYLAIVLTRLGHEYRERRWGKWRTSAAAKRLGRLAMRLEVLVYRDGMRLTEAGELLRTRGDTDLPDRELAALLGQLPRRSRPGRGAEREVSIDTVADDATADDATADDCAIEEETDAERRAIYRKLDEALGRLAPEEELIVRMHVLEGHTLADVARVLGVEQRPLYRRRDVALARLLEHLAEAGVHRESVYELIGGALPPPVEGEEGRQGARDDGDPARSPHRGVRRPTDAPSTDPRPPSPPTGLSDAERLERPGA